MCFSSPGTAEFQLGTGCSPPGTAELQLGMLNSGRPGSIAGTTLQLSELPFLAPIITGALWAP